MDIKSSHRTSYLAFCVTAKKTAIQLTLPPKKQLYSSHSLSHGPVALYSYSARVYSRAIQNTVYSLYTIQPYTPTLWASSSPCQPTRPPCRAAGRRFRASKYLRACRSLCPGVLGRREGGAVGYRHRKFLVVSTDTRNVSPASWHVD